MKCDSEAEAAGAVCAVPEDAPRSDGRPGARRRAGQAGTTTVMFVLTVFWAVVILVIFVQVALIGYTWEVTGYAAYASARSRITGKLFNDDYKHVADTVMKNSMPAGWGSTWLVQELPLGIGVIILYGKSIFGFPVPVFGRATVPYSKLNVFEDPSYDVWDKGDNN